MPTFHTVDFAHAQHNIVVLRHTALPFIASPAPHANGGVAVVVTFVDHPTSRPPSPT